MTAFNKIRNFVHKIGDDIEGHKYTLVAEGSYHTDYYLISNDGIYLSYARALSWHGKEAIGTVKLFAGPIPVGLDTVEKEHLDKIILEYIRVKPAISKFEFIQEKLKVFND